MVGSWLCHCQLRQEWDSGVGEQQTACYPSPEAWAGCGKGTLFSKILDEVGCHRGNSLVTCPWPDGAVFVE